MKTELEEAAINHSRIMFDHEICDSNVSFKAGAKWQQEQDLSMVQGYLSANLKNIELLQRSYSEEVMFSFSQWISSEDWVYLPSKNYWVNEEQEELEQKLTSKELFNIWFNHFKK